MQPADVEAALKQAEEVLAGLDRLRKDLEAMAADLRAQAEQRAQEAVVGMVPLEQQQAAQALVARAVRIADEVGTWAVSRSPVGLAQRLVPEFRAAAEELQAYLDAAPKPAPRGPRTPPTGARHAP